MVKLLNVYKEKYIVELISSEKISIKALSYLELTNCSTTMFLLRQFLSITSCGKQNPRGESLCRLIYLHPVCYQLNYNWKLKGQRKQYMHMVSVLNISIKDFLEELLTTFCL